MQFLAVEPEPMLSAYRLRLTFFGIWQAQSESRAFEQLIPVFLICF